MHLYRVELDDIYLCSAEVGIDCVFLRATTDNAGPTSKYKGTERSTRPHIAWSTRVQIVEQRHSAIFQPR